MISKNKKRYHVVYTLAITKCDELKDRKENKLRFICDNKHHFHVPHYIEKGTDLSIIKARIFEIVNDTFKAAEEFFKKIS